MIVECWRGEASLERLRPQWESLHALSPTATIFNSYPFVDSWWRHFGAGDELQLWQVRDGNNLVAIAPLYPDIDDRGHPTRRLVGGVEIADYLDVLVAPGQEEAAAAVLLEGWADAPCPCSVELRMVKAASPMREAFLRRARMYDYEIEEWRDENCPVITLPESFESYLDALDGKQRRELRRKLRKGGSEALIGWYRVNAPPLDEPLAIFFALHETSGEDKARFMDARMRGFFDELAHRLAGRGWLDLIFLTVDGRHAACYFNFRYENEIQIYNSGYDESVARGLSPGWLLLAYAIEDAIADGVRRIDFLRGDEQYKYRFGAVAEPIYGLRLAPPS